MARVRRMMAHARGHRIPRSPASLSAATRVPRERRGQWLCALADRLDPPRQRLRDAANLLRTPAAAEAGGGVAPREPHRRRCEATWALLCRVFCSISGDTLVNFSFDEPTPHTPGI